MDVLSREPEHDRSVNESPQSTTATSGTKDASKKEDDAARHYSPPIDRPHSITISTTEASTLCTQAAALGTEAEADPSTVAYERVVSSIPAELLVCWALHHAYDAQGEQRYICIDECVRKMEAVLVQQGDLLGVRVGTAPLGIDIPIVRTLHAAFALTEEQDSAFERYQAACSLIEASPPLWCGSRVGPKYVDQVVIPYCLHGRHVLANIRAAEEEEDEDQEEECHTFYETQELVQALRGIIFDSRSDESVVIRAQKMLVPRVLCVNNAISLPFGYNLVPLRTRLREVVRTLGPLIMSNTARALIEVGHPVIAICISGSRGPA
jgi:hypothetical protein